MERAFRNNAKYYQSISQTFTDDQYGIRQWSISKNLRIQPYPSRSFKLKNKNKNKNRIIETIKIEQNLFSTKKSKRKRKTSSKVIIPCNSNESIIYRTETANGGYGYENNITLSFKETNSNITNYGFSDIIHTNDGYSNENNVKVSFKETSNCTNYGVADTTNNTFIVSTKYVNYSQSESDDSDHQHQDYRLSKSKTHSSFNHSKNLLNIPRSSSSSPLIYHNTFNGSQNMNKFEPIAASNISNSHTFSSFSPVATSNLGRNPRPIIIDGLNIGHT